MNAKPQAVKAPQPVTRDQAAKSMRRIICQFPTGPAAINTKDNFDAIYEQVKLARVPADLFEAACIRLAGTMQPYKPPMAAEYLEAVRKIEAETKRRVENCPKCGGRGLYLIQVFDRHKGGMTDAYTQCHECVTR